MTSTTSTTRPPARPNSGAAPAAPATAPLRRMTMDAIRRGPRQVPDRVLLMGVEGIGKSTWGASAPDPIFIATEEGTHHLDVASFPLATSFRDVLDALDTLATQPHDFKTVVVDTVDGLEPLIHKATCARNGWGSIDEPEFQRGYEATISEWRLFLTALERVQARGMEVILLAHVAIRNHKNPTGPDYDRYEAKIHKKAAPLLREWVFSALFATHVEYAEKVKGGAKHKGMGGDRRVLKTTHAAAWDGKNRWGLPEELPLDYAAYAEARAAGAAAGPDAFRAAAEALIAEWAPDEATAAKARKFVADCGDNATKLARAVDALKTRVAQATAERAAPVTTAQEVS